MQMMEGILLGFGQSAVPDFSSCLKDDEKEMQLIEDVTFINNNLDII